MSSSDKRKDAQRVRLANRDRLARSDGPAADGLDPLTIVGLIPGDAEGLRPAIDNDRPLVVTLPPWKNLGTIPGMSDNVRIEWARAGDSGYQTLKEVAFAHPILIGDFPKPVTLDPFDKALQGHFTLRWTLKAWNAPGYNEESTTQPLRIDRTPPYDLLNPTEFILATSEINDAYLAANGNKVIVEIPAYADYEAADKISFGWQRVEPVNPEDIIPITPNPVDIPADRKLEIPLAVIQDAGDGPAFCAYRLFDKAGNPSRLSHMRLRNVALGDLPVAPLIEPNVPLADDNDLIDQADAHTREVAVIIPVVNNGKVTDTIYVTWGTQELEPHPVVPRAETRVKVPLEVLKAQYTQLTGEQVTPVSYEVRRGSRPFAAPAITVKVDFSEPVVNPEWPDITNPNLGLVEVRGPSDLENELVLTDAGADATATFLLYDGALADDQIQLMWDGIAVLPHVITSEVAGAEITIAVQSSIIDERSNNPALPVFYSVHRAGYVNSPISRTTPVKVNIHTVVPDAADFPGKITPGDFMFCHLLDVDPVEGLGIKVHIPANARYLKEGVVVKVKWQGHAGYGATVPSPDEPLPGTLLEHTFEPVTAAQVINGLDWVVRPYAQHILPLYGGESDQIGRGIVSYTVSGVTPPSPDAIINAALGTGTGTCPLP